MNENRLTEIKRFYTSIKTTGTNIRSVLIKITDFSTLTFLLMSTLNKVANCTICAFNSVTVGNRSKTFTIDKKKS